MPASPVTSWSPSPRSGWRTDGCQCTSGRPSAARRTTVSSDSYVQGLSVFSQVTVVATENGTFALARLPFWISTGPVFALFAYASRAAWAAVGASVCRAALAGSPAAQASRNLVAAPLTSAAVSGPVGIASAWSAASSPPVKAQAPTPAPITTAAAAPITAYFLVLLVPGSRRTSRRLLPTVPSAAPPPPRHRRAPA